MQRLTATFVAVGEDGLKYRVHVFTDYKTTGGQEVPGRHVFLTSSGLSVIRIDKGQYRLFLGGTRLTSTDPNAP